MRAMSRTSWQQWLWLFVAASFLFYQFIELNIMAPLAMTVGHFFSLSTLGIGILSSSDLLGNVLMLIPAGMLLDRYPVKKLLLLNLALTTLFTFIFAASSNIFISALARFFIGASGAFCFTGAVRFAVNIFPKTKMALATGLIYMTGMLGGISAQGMFSTLSPVISWRGIFAVVGALGILFFLLVWQLLPSTTNQTQHTSPLATIKKIVVQFKNWQPAIFVGALNLPLFVVGALWGNLYLTHARHLSSEQAAMVNGMIFLGAIIGSPLAGRLADVLNARKPVMLFTSIAAMIVFSIILFSPNLSVPLLASLFLLLGIAAGSQALGYTVAIEGNPSHIAASVTSFVSIVTIAGAMLFQPIFGELLHAGQTANTYNFTGAMLSILMMLGVGVVSSACIKE
jgi:MFS family permease